MVKNCHLLFYISNDNVTLTECFNIPFWIPAGTNTDDLECRIHLKVRLVDGTLDVRLLRVLDSTIRIGVARGGGGRPASRCSTET